MVTMLNTEPNEVAAEVAGETGRFGKTVALGIAIMAVILALAGMGGDNASEDAVNSNIQASDLWAFFQAKTIRQTSYKLAKDQIQLEREKHPEMAPKLDALLAEYQRKIDEYESNPAEGDGRKELTIAAKNAESARQSGLRKDGFFDMASTVLQVAIVLASVSILAHVPWVFRLSLLGALAGAILTGYAFFVA